MAQAFRLGAPRIVIIFSVTHPVLGVFNRQQVKPGGIYPRKPLLWFRSTAHAWSQNIIRIASASFGNVQIWTNKGVDWIGCTQLVQFMMGAPLCEPTKSTNHQPVGKGQYEYICFLPKPLRDCCRATFRTLVIPSAC